MFYRVAKSIGTLQKNFGIWRLILFSRCYFPCDMAKCLDRVAKSIGSLQKNFGIWRLVPFSRCYFPCEMAKCWDGVANLIGTGNCRRGYWTPRGAPRPRAPRARQMRFLVRSPLRIRKKIGPHKGGLARGIGPPAEERGSPRSYHGGYESYADTDGLYNGWFGSGH